MRKPYTLTDQVAYLRRKLEARDPFHDAGYIELVNLAAGESTDYTAWTSQVMRSEPLKIH